MEYNFRLVVLGSEYVGKSSIINKYIYDNFKNEHVSTIGATFNVFYPKKYNNVKLEIWDTAGQERYKSIVPLYYKNASIILIIFDITNRNSFENAKYWIDNVLQNTFNNPLIALVGNKKDLEYKRQVSMKEAMLCAEINDINYYEMSALTGYGINSSFDNIVDNAYNKFESPITENSKLLHIMENKEENKRKCCY